MYYRNEFRLVKTFLPPFVLEHPHWWSRKRKRKMLDLIIRPRFWATPPVLTVAANSKTRLARDIHIYDAMIGGFSSQSWPVDLPELKSSSHACIGKNGRLGLRRGGSTGVGHGVLRRRRCTKATRRLSPRKEAQYSAKPDTRSVYTRPNG